MSTRAERRDRVVEVALGEIGQGQPNEYWRNVLGPDYRGQFPRHWCGAFALYCLHEAELAEQVLWIVGKGFCEVQRLPKTKKPQPGDVAYFADPYQHHAVVATWTPQSLVTIDGNQGSPAPVRRRTRHPSMATCFYSIEPLLAKAGLPPDNDGQPTLGKGSVGAAVVKLQLRLDGLKPDGKFGALTETAVMLLQRRAGLQPSGVMTLQTWEALNAGA